MFYLYAKYGKMISLVARTEHFNKQEMAALAEVMLDQTERFKKLGIVYMLTSEPTRQITVDYTALCQFIAGKGKAANDDHH